MYIFYLDQPSAEEAPGCFLLLLPCRLLLLGSHAPKSDGDVQRRLQAGLEVHPVFLLEPAGRQRQPVPRRRPQHVGYNAPVELQARLLSGTPRDVGETLGGVRVLPRPLKLTEKYNDRIIHGSKQSHVLGLDLI